MSVPSNISEGFGRHYTPVYVNHLWIANESDYELQTQIELAVRMQLCAEDEGAAIIADAEEMSRILKEGLVHSLERPTPQKP